MNEIIWQILRSGFPLLVVVIYGMLITSVWKNTTFDRNTQWKWSSVIVLPGLVAVALFLFIISLETDNQQLLNIMAVVILFLPFTGVFAWLVGTR